MEYSTSEKISLIQGKLNMSESEIIALRSKIDDLLNLLETCKPHSHWKQSKNIRWWYRNIKFCPNISIMILKTIERLNRLSKQITLLC